MESVSACARTHFLLPLMVISLNELDNSDNLEDGNPATPYLHIMLLVLNILRVSNPAPLNIRNLKVV